MSSWHLCFGVHVGYRPLEGATLEDKLRDAMTRPLGCDAWIRPLKDQEFADPSTWLMLHCTLPYEHEGPHALQWQDGEVLA